MTNRPIGRPTGCWPATDRGLTPRALAASLGHEACADALAAEEQALGGMLFALAAQGKVEELKASLEQAKARAAEEAAAVAGGSAGAHAGTGAGKKAVAALVHQVNKWVGVGWCGLRWHLCCERNGVGVGYGRLTDGRGGGVVVLPSFYMQTRPYTHETLLHAAARSAERGAPLVIKLLASQYGE